MAEEQKKKKHFEQSEKYSQERSKMKNKYEQDLNFEFNLKYKNYFMCFILMTHKSLKYICLIFY